MMRLKVYINENWWSDFDADAFPRKGESFKIGDDLRVVKDVQWTLNNNSDNFLYVKVFLE